MNEAEWETCTDSNEMECYVGGRGFDRKCRLFGCAFCRRVWDLLTHPESRSAVETAERFADGKAGPAELESAWEASRALFESIDVGPRTLAKMAAWIASQTCHERAHFGSPSAAAEAMRVACLRPGARARAERKALPGLMRDIFPNPFRPSFIDLSISEARNGLVREMAQAIYEDHRFENMARLADALEKAGCRDAHVLDHCRHGQHHARGCWVLDKLLGRPDMALTEEEWSRAEDALDLLYFVRPSASERRLRLLACACGRAAWSEMVAECSRKAIEIGERFANGEASDADLEAMRRELGQWDDLHPSNSEWSDQYRDYIWVSDELASHQIAGAVLCPDAWDAAINTASYVRCRQDRTLHRFACGALRDIFQYPFRTVAKDASWLTDKVVALVRAPHNERSFDKMYALADELEEAGCRNVAILAHCRSRVPHVKGCWVIDLLSTSS